MVCLLRKNLMLELYIMKNKQFHLSSIFPKPRTFIDSISSKSTLSFSFWFPIYQVSSTHSVSLSLSLPVPLSFILLFLLDTLCVCCILVNSSSYDLLFPDQNLLLLMFLYTCMCVILMAHALVGDNMCFSLLFLPPCLPGTCISFRVLFTRLQMESVETATLYMSPRSFC